MLLTFPIYLHSLDLFFLFQFNCTVRQPKAPNPPMRWPPETRMSNVSFSIELYKTDLFHIPTQGIFSVAENGQIFVEVRNYAIN